MNWLRLLWLKHCPEFFRDRKRAKAHFAFLQKCEKVDKELNRYWRAGWPRAKGFGTPAHADEVKLRSMQIPGPVYNSFDCRRRTMSERSVLLREQLRYAFKKAVEDGQDAKP